MAVNWALGLQQGNAGDAFSQAFQQGQQTNRQNTARSAMAALVADPNNQRALQALAQADPQAAQQFQQQHAQQAMAALEHHRDNIIKGAQIIRQVNPKDQASYTQALQLAQQAGIDLSEVPQQFDPQYVAGVSKLADTFAPQTGQQPHFIPFQQGGGVVKVNPDGTSSMVVLPNDGSQQAGAPAGATPQPGHVEDGYRFKGGNPADPNAWEKLGGQTATPSAMFP
jgi:hypothetical protein